MKSLALEAGVPISEVLPKPGSPRTRNLVVAHNVTGVSVIGLPTGVVVRSLGSHADERGSHTEVFRQSGLPNAAAVLVNVVESRSGVLRGPRLDARHVEHLVALSGRAIIGMIDCRPDSETFLAVCTVPLGVLDRAISIPAGVARAVWFPRGGATLHGLDAEWGTADEFRCRWDDPEFAIPWTRHGDEHPARRLGGPVVSHRDATAGSFHDLLTGYHRHAHAGESARASIFVSSSVVGSSVASSSMPTLAASVG